MLYKPYFQKESPSPDELTHHGVLGMKWGVRRFQNKDGTLTSAGQKRAKKEGIDFANAIKTGKKEVEKIMRKIGHITYFTAKMEDVRNQKLQKRAAELASKYGDKAKVEVKGNKIVVTGADGRDTWTVT